MENMNIGLIGYGHLGKGFEKRLAESGLDAKLLISQGRGKNLELVQESDIVVLTVRPLQLAALTEEIRGKVGSTDIISFTAATPKAALETALDHSVVRAMSDIQFEQILAEEGAGNFLSALSQNPLIEVADEELVDAHTIFVGCLPGVIAWQLVHNRSGAIEWMQRYFAFIQSKLGIAESVLQNILGRGILDTDPAATLLRVTTPGGITESLVEQLERDPHSSLEELTAAAWKRTHEVRSSVAKSFTRVS